MEKENFQELVVLVRQGVFSYFFKGHPFNKYFNNYP